MGASGRACTWLAQALGTASRLSGGWPCLLTLSAQARHLQPWPAWLVCHPLPLLLPRTCLPDPCLAHMLRPLLPGKPWVMQHRLFLVEQACLLTPWLLPTLHWLRPPLLAWTWLPQPTAVQPTLHWLRLPPLPWDWLPQPGAVQVLPQVPPLAQRLPGLLPWGMPQYLQCRAPEARVAQPAKSWQRRHHRLYQCGAPQCQRHPLLAAWSAHVGAQALWLPAPPPAGLAHRVAALSRSGSAVLCALGPAAMHPSALVVCAAAAPALANLAADQGPLGVHGVVVPLTPISRVRLVLSVAPTVYCSLDRACLFLSTGRERARPWLSMACCAQWRPWCA